MPLPRYLRPLAMDLAFWFAAPCVFLAIYVGYLRQPATAIAPHLWTMALLFVLQAMVRLLVSRWIRNERIRLLAASIVLAVFVGAMLTYYLLAFISVRFWGAVVALPAIPTFFRQAPDLAEAVGLGPAFAAVATLLFIVAVYLACRAHLARRDWTHGLDRPGWIKALCALAVGCALWVQVSNATAAPWIAAAEPLSLTVFPLAGTRNIEGHLLTEGRSKLLDALADRARADYVPAGADSPKPNLVLIVVDALRPADMSLYGYARETTPYLDELARAGRVRKFIAHAPCSDTGCGLLSLTGSRLPGDFSFRPFSLHEALRRNGYRIHVIQSGDHTYFQPMRGYYGTVDTWIDGNSTHTRSIDDDQMIVDEVSRMPDWDGTPTMFHFHLMSAHVTRKDDGRRTFSPASSYLVPPRTDGSGADISVPSATNYYDNGVLGADRVIRTLCALLRQKGYLQRSLVVVTADHGEALGEHGMFTHANSVREEVLKVPVVFSASGYAPRPFAADMGFPLQIDIAPTILTEFGIPMPASWAGRPLQQPPAPFVAYFEERDYAGLIDTRHAGSEWKYWLDYATGEEFAYDLASDPRETRNVAGKLPGDLLGDWRRRLVYSRPGH